MSWRASLVILGGIVMWTVVRADAPAVDAAALFKRSCTMCHGADGRATTPAARKMGVKDLTLSELTDEQIRGAIMAGVRGAKGSMPAFGAKFTAMEVDALIAHLRSLRPAENPAKPPPSPAN